MMFFGFWFALVYGHFYYGYGNGINNDGEELETCYAPQDKDVQIPWSSSGGGNIPDDYHNVNDNFILCARFGFYTYLCVTLLLVMFQCIGNRDGCLLSLVSCLTAPIGFLYITNLLMVMIYRWRHAGKICSGDYLLDKEIFANHEL